MNNTKELIEETKKVIKDYKNFSGKDNLSMLRGLENMTTDHVLKTLELYSKCPKVVILVKLTKHDSEINNRTFKWWEYQIEQHFRICANHVLMNNKIKVYMCVCLQTNKLR